MPGTLGALLERHAATALGRDDEMEVLLDLVSERGPVAVFVHGVAGVGKSTLLRAFAAEAEDRGASVLLLDGGDVEPTPSGFLTAVAGAAGVAGMRSPEAVAAALRGHGSRVVVAVDTYERLRLVDGWLRQAFIPALPDTVRIAIAGRDAPGASWLRTFGPLLRPLALGNLATADAEDLLRRSGLDDREAAWVNRFVVGHPLSLRLAASAVRERPGAVEDAVLPTVTQELAALYLDGLHPATRRTLDAVSVVRRVTLPLLRALLPDADAQEELARLSALPFAEVGREGLLVHDTVREATSALLRATDPARHRRHRTAALRQIRADVAASAAGPERWSATADLIALVEEPLVREAFFPTRAQRYAVDTARASDGEGILAIASRHEPPDHVDVLRRWWNAAPEAFRVARDGRGDVIAFTILCDPADVGTRLLAADPVTPTWQEHLRRRRLAPGRRALLARAMLAWGTGNAPAPCFSALLQDLERACLEGGDAVARLYVPYRPDSLHEQIALTGFVPLRDGPSAVLGGVEYRSLLCDLGPDSLTGWLVRLAGRDLALDEAPAIDLRSGRLVLDGRPVELTNLELDVLGYLHEREGQAVGRQALLRDVWGHGWTGGSNVVEVVVSALRRKLGARAGAIETVRGVGYRLRLPH